VTVAHAGAFCSLPVSCQPRECRQWPPKWDVPVASARRVQITPRSEPVRASVRRVRLHVRRHRTGAPTAGHGKFGDSKSALIAGPCQGQVAAESESGICQAALEGMGADSVTYYEYL
jgi:hypothetical protein